MIDLEDVKLYLPKYLSPETEEKLLKNLSDFPENIKNRMYSQYGKDGSILYQGDGVSDMLVINLPDKQIKETQVVILSNTCDIDESNKRKYSTNIVYSPIIRLNKYKKLLKNNKKFNTINIKNHLDDIRKQKITQIFYFPPSSRIDEESIIFFDRLCSCDNRFINREIVSNIRLFSLSQYGFYLFLFKLSIHFTRMHEGIDRKY